MFSHSTATVLRPGSQNSGLQPTVSAPPIPSGENASAAIDVLPFDAAATREQLRRLPTELGVMLVGLGVVGAVLPGMIGVPLIVTGSAALLPRTFAPVERWFEQRFPGAYQEGLRYVDRFLRDFNRRFPQECLGGKQASS